MIIPDLLPLPIQDVKIIQSKRFDDARGFFMETYNKNNFECLGIYDEFVQDNYSYSKSKGTVRGLHFQAPPAAQAKLVRVMRGAILDVAVDVRKSSPTYGQHVKAELSAENGLQIFIPAGFAHGFCTLSDDTEVAYKCSSFYAPAQDGGIFWADPSLGIRWPVDEKSAVVSDKDRVLPLLANLANPFDGM